MLFFIFFILFSFSLEDLFKIAEENSPYLHSLKSEIEVKSLEILPSSALPNPMFDFMYQNVGYKDLSIGKEEMSMFSINFEQNLLYPKKRKAMEEIGKENLNVSENFYKVAIAEIKKRIREIYADIYSLNKEKEGLFAGMELLNSLKIASSGLISSGKGNQESFLKIEITIDKLQLKLKEIEKEIFLNYEELKRILGKPFDFSDLKINSLPNFEIEENFLNKAIENSPSIKYFEGILKLKEKELLKRKLDLKPNISAFSSLGLRGGFDPVFSFGTKIEFPFWKEKKEKKLILAGEKEVDIAKKLIEEEKLKVKEEVAGAMEVIKKTDERINIYEESFLKKSSLAIDSALSLYVAGKGDFSTVIEDINLWIEGKIEVSKLEGERFKALSKILFHLK